MIHPRSEELNELIDGRLNDREKESLLRHFQECRSCASAYRLLLRIDDAARSQPVESTGPKFVDQLMSTVVGLSSPAHPKFERLLKFGANIFALLVVAGLIYTAYSLAGRYGAGGSSGGREMQGVLEISMLMNRAGDVWRDAAAQLTQFVVGKSGAEKLPIWIFAVWAIIFVVVLEKIFGKRLRRVMS